jgi:type VI secretion system protein ImpL
MAADWAQAYPGAMGQPVRDKLMVHLAAFLDQDFSTYAVDGALVDQARRVFSRMPMADRVYARLRGTAPDVPPWRPAEALGLSGQRLFVLQSGAPVTEAAVPGLFTVDGLYRSFLPRLPKAMAEAASESWVLGPEAAASASDPVLLEGAVVRLYAQDYIAEWQKMLDSVTLAPLGGPAKAAEALNLLSAPNSPMRDLLLGVARQLSPGTPPAEPAAPSGAAASAASALVKGATKAAAGAVKGLPGGGAAAKSITEAMGGKPAINSASVVAQIVEDRFKPLREASGKPLDGTLAVLNALYVQVAKLATLAPGAAPPPPAPGLDPGQQLQAEAQRAPEPLSRWLRSLATTSSGVVTGGTRAALAAAGKQALAPFCQGVEARFPFKREPGAPDMPMVDFTRLFGRGGAFEQFYGQNLSSLVDRSQATWKAIAPDGGTPPISPGDLAQFQRADVIREAFFPPALPNQAGAGFTFELAPVSLDGGAKGAVLEVNGTKTPIAAGAVGGRTVTLQWPSQGNISLTFDGEAATGALGNDGPWASLRFVARGKLTPTGDATRFRLSFQQGVRTAEFELRTSSRVHPFALRELAEFRCPQLAP